MERVSMLFLKFAVILMGFPVLFLCIFLVPEIADFSVELFPDHAYIQYLIYVDLYATALPYYVALYQVFKLLGYVEKNEAFSESSVTALRRIRSCAVLISGLYILGMPLFYLLAEFDDAPGIILIGMCMIFASLVVAIFAAVLQKVLRNAIDIKSENDLTV